MGIILLLGFPLPGDPHVGENHDTCGQGFGPGGSRSLHLSGSGRSGQHESERRAGAGLLEKHGLYLAKDKSRSC
jgi:hypothetical protein